MERTKTFQEELGVNDKKYNDAKNFVEKNCPIIGCPNKNNIPETCSMFRIGVRKLLNK